MFTNIRGTKYNWLHFNNIINIYIYIYISIDDLLICKIFLYFNKFLIFIHKQMHKNKQILYCIISSYDIQIVCDKYLYFM